MALKNGNRRGSRPNSGAPEAHRLHPETKQSIWAIVAVGAAVILILARIGAAGPAGRSLYKLLNALFGGGYFLLPLACLTVALVLIIASERRRLVGMTALGAALAVLAVLGLIHIAAAGRGGWFGYFLGAFQIPFGRIAGFIINLVILAAALLMTVNVPLKFRWPSRDADEGGEGEEKETKAAAPVVTGESKETASAAGSAETEKPRGERRATIPLTLKKRAPAPVFTNYVPPPLDLLKSSSEKPTTGDLRANANIIKRTLESFGIAVEMGEINIGPKVTRYTLKPAEGMKLSRITALNQDLALALAAHPIRIEAPIPGKSLVGIEVPNKAAALVRLGSLMAYPEFQTSGLLGFTLGRDVTGEPLFADIERMPHLLIAGATGSGKSVMIHSLILSLLYKNSPATLRLILIDPKRVELTIYEHLPHLVSPVIVESKKAIGVFRWAIAEMERRYEVLQKAGSRDIKSYNQNGGKDNPLPFLVIIVDELADLMTSYGREVEGSIVRLAQMARATGLHLVLSTQRPSVEIITGLIKANITSRIALQVASQVDSRTILDTGGAEKLLGGGDLLFVSSDLSKPKRIQGAYVTEEEINRVADFIRENNAAVPAEPVALESADEENGDSKNLFDNYLANDDDDELYDEAVQVVAQAQKASASLLQRRLKVGYARAARLLDIMEEKGVIGPGEGAKPREVFMDRIPDAE